MQLRWWLCASDLVYKLTEHHTSCQKEIVSFGWKIIISLLSYKRTLFHLSQPKKTVLIFMLIWHWKWTWLCGLLVYFFFLFFCSQSIIWTVFYFFPYRTQPHCWTCFIDQSMFSGIVLDTRGTKVSFRNTHTHLFNSFSYEWIFNIHLKVGKHRFDFYSHEIWTVSFVCYPILHYMFA